MSDRKIQATKKTGGVTSITGGPAYAGYNPSYTINKTVTLAGTTRTIIEELDNGIILQQVVEKDVSGNVVIYPQERIDNLPY
jgi:hypothetical protein